MLVNNAGIRMSTFELQSTGDVLRWATTTSVMLHVLHTGGKEEGRCREPEKEPTVGMPTKEKGGGQPPSYYFWELDVKEIFPRLRRGNAATPANIQTKKIPG